MFFPISDDDRGVTTTAFVTYALLAINLVAFAYQTSDESFTYAWSMIPKEITTGEDLVVAQQLPLPDGGLIEIPQAPGPPFIWLTLITSMFLHGGVGHLIGNMLYLWIFGNNVEHRFGHALFLLFYLTSGIIGSFAQIAISPNSALPNLGASGAIAGILGAYVVLFPRNKINAVFFLTIVSVPAIFLLGMWGMMQLINGLGTISFSNSSSGGVAYMAHLGGFATGFVVAFVVRKNIKEEPDSALRRQYDADPTVRRIW